MSTTSFKALASHRPAGQVMLARPETGGPVTLQSPALSVMTHFAHLQPVTVPPHTSLFAANETMVARGVRLLLVVDEQRHLLGIVSTHDTLGERPMQLRDQGKGSLFDLTVADLMHPLGEIDMLDHADVRHANVGDLVATLKRLGRQHVLVTTDESDGSTRIRGLFSATQISRQLGVEVQTFEVARTFSQIEAALAG